MDGFSNNQQFGSANNDGTRQIMLRSPESSGHLLDPTATGSPDQGPSHSHLLRDLQPCRFRSLTFDMFRCHEDPSAPGSSAGSHLDERAKEIIGKVREFFIELKRQLGDEASGTIFNSPAQLTALACGVSAPTVRSCTRRGSISNPQRRDRRRNRKQLAEAVVRKYGNEWGEIVRHLIHGKLRQEADVTTEGIRAELQEAHPSFKMSHCTFYYFLRGLGFSYKINRGQRIIFERPDLVEKRAAYLFAVEQARSRGSCLVFMDETWVFDGMTKKRGWNDNSIPLFAPASTFQEYSYGKTAAKNKGRRAIVIGAITEEGPVPGCTKILVSGYREADDDYHRDMDHVVFEDWVREAIPRMRIVAAGRPLALILDNAPYHSRQLEKIPNRSSKKAEIEGYLRAHNVTVGSNATKNDLLEELRHFIASRGGIDALRSYAVDTICGEHGIAVIRLPPYHCILNPIEMCWSQMKAHLCRVGKPGDTLELVRTRTAEWMERLPASMCASWFQHVVSLENAAKLKIAADRTNNNSSRGARGWDFGDASSSDEEDAPDLDEDLTYFML